MNAHRESEQLSAYLDGELDAAERRAIETHLAGCTDCSSLLEALRATTAEMRALPLDEPTPQQSWRLRAELRRARRPWLARYSRVVAAAAGVAAIGSAIAFATLTGSKHGTLASAPQALAVGNAVISIQDTNFDASSARSLLFTSENTVTAGAAVGTPMPGAQPVPPKYSDRKAAGAAALAPLSPAPVSPVDYSKEIKTCERQVLAHSRESARAVEYIVATYNDVPAFLLVYELPADHPTRREVWVVRRSDCSVLYFAQHPT